ncbi:leukocyte elastase inhibitor isoform X2 [Daphnia magna]|uniref:Protein Z-dependent protease inhibitor n=2 Tax=Daphnia magna TaxID=35525 RepID=A0A0P6DIZ7_9CRUS|nr:leukocyte elastase inhibitor isoform X2 [Daphnia magna]KZS04159.1 Protein Z-dependent protease inhibitor [Daphnia magna]
MTQLAHRHYQPLDGSSGSVSSDSPFRSMIRALPFVATTVFLVICLYHIPTMASISKNPPTIGDQAKAAAALQNFSVTLFQAVGKQYGPTDNVFISPFSVAAVLSMVGVGARGNTALQLKKSMGLTNFEKENENSDTIIGSLIQSMKGDGNFTLEAANQLYVADKYQLVDDFQRNLKENYGAEGQRVDFAVDASRAKINQWVEEFTQQKIKDLLPEGSVNDLTRLVLVNAIYFKGNWMRKFDSSLTLIEPFYLGSKDNRKDVNMMHIDAEFRTGFIESLDARLLELPYVGRKLSMFIVLPNKMDGLPELEAKLHETSLDDSNVEMRSAKLHVSIPKFKLEADVKLKDILINMGMSDIFDEKSADFSGISGEKDLYVSNIFHKSFIDVNEEGSEAAAATGAVMMTRMMMLPVEPPAPFVADHPFYYFIRDNTTKMILFSGRLAQPPSS